MALHKYICVKSALILPRENGGTVTLSEGQVIVGPHYAKFVGYGLQPYAERVAVAPPPSLKAPVTLETPKPPAKEIHVTAPAPAPVPPRQDGFKPNPPKPPAPEPTKVEGSVLAAAVAEDTEKDSLPKDVAQLKALKKAELADMAKELGLDNTGAKDTLVKRIADELGLS